MAKHIKILCGWKCGLGGSGGRGEDVEFTKDSRILLWLFWFYLVFLTKLATKQTPPSVDWWNFSVNICTELSCSVMSESLWPHGLQPARLLHPWDFPGKSTGVSCHFLLQKYLWWWFSRSVVANILRPQGLHVPCQAPLSMGFSRQDYSSGLPFPSLEVSCEVPLNTSGLTLIFYMTVCETILYIPVTCIMSFSLKYVFLT